MEGSPTSLRCLTVRTPLCDGLSLKRQHKSSSKVTKLNLLVNLLRCQLTTVFSIALNRLFDPVLTPFLLQRVGNPLTVRVPGLNLVIRVVVSYSFRKSISSPRLITFSELSGSATVFSASLLNTIIPIRRLAADIPSTPKPLRTDQPPESTLHRQQPDVVLRLDQSHGDVQDELASVLLQGHHFDSLRQGDD
jgi:hypothetical protein